MDVERLIEEVGKYPVLYDMNHENYRNTAYKQKIWKRIAETLGVKGGIRECKQKWVSIRDQFRKTLKKRNSVYGQACVRQYKYKHEDHLKFLIPHISEVDTETNISYSKEDNETDEQESVEEGSINDEYYVQQLDMVDEINEFTSIKREAFVEPSRKRQFQCESESQQSESKKSLNLPAEQHPVDAFLMGIAPPLKSLNPILFNQAKGKIFAIVQDFELQHLTNNPRQ